MRSWNGTSYIAGYRADPGPAQPRNPAKCVEVDVVLKLTKM